MNLMFLTFGDNLKNHAQACFAILSFLSKNEGIVDKIYMFTDRPDFYEFFGDRVQCIKITKETLTEWEGEHQFFWRVKIKAVEHLVNLDPNSHILYLDSDTFKYKSISKLKDLLDNNQGIMHKKEGALSDLTTKTEKMMLKQMKNKTFAGITIDGKSEMWNAGTIGVPKGKNREIVEKSLSLCDEMCAAGVTRRLIEQFSFSVATKEICGLTPAEEQIGHYWGNKSEWNEMISGFFTNVALSNLDLNATIEKFKEINLIEIPIIKQRKNTQVRLERLLSKAFKYRNFEKIEA
ncbi:hypothetical protein [Aureivirga sp. CE67]|uniref:hypothetical protein n=1 Tax=Aureivirga sp. CE67 TaxID=1788983 RepID=UPI0018CA579B|nr:hypothetical protein [Aureivirga sp. CE67]